MQGLEIDAEPGRHADREILHHHIGLINKLQKQPLSFVGLQIQGNRLLAPAALEKWYADIVLVAAFERGAVAAKKDRRSRQGVAGLGIVDADNLRPQACQQQRGMRAEVILGQVQDPDPLQNGIIHAFHPIPTMPGREISRSACRGIPACVFP